MDSSNASKMVEYELDQMSAAKRDVNIVMMVIVVGLTRTRGIMIVFGPRKTPVKMIMMLRRLMNIAMKMIMTVILGLETRWARTSVVMIIIPCLTQMTVRMIGN
jgi:hypothetical protein